MDLKNDPKEILSGNDNIVIIDNFESIRGGKTLDVTGFAPDVIEAGHIIIQKSDDKVCKPHPVKDGAYIATPTGHEIIGILVASTPTNRPFAGVLVRGTINLVASPNKLSENTALLTAVKTALGDIVRFTSDKA